MATHGKKYIAARSKIDPAKRYTFQEAVQLAADTSFVKFDQTLDIAVRLGVDPRHADQMVRGTVVLPNPLGKTTVPLTIWSAWRGSTPNRTAMSRVWSNLAKDVSAAK